ncbi:MAG TPA: inositol monophosphatase family protein [Anaerolineales bacterium]|nr:inositol monophosphatase family protein [Anaerolineales bacterium]
MTTSNPRLDLALEVARAAGGLLRDGLGRATVEHKSPLELVTEFDRASERLIVERVLASFPQDGLLAEEGSHRPGGEWRWYIDPLDGTTNFAHGLPHFAVSIGAEAGGSLAFGVVYDPMRDEMFHAARGQGAYLNDRRLHVSAAVDLSRSLLVTGFPYDLRDNQDNNLDHFSRLARRSLAVRRFGSAALDLAYVAAGRFDGYWELRLAPWDLAAGIVLVLEAGGTVTRADGAPHPLQPPPSIAASNGPLHGPLLEALRERPAHDKD